jgi:DNA-binding MarR family transcriptional regulator
MGSLYQLGDQPPSTLAQLEKVTSQSMSQIISHLDEAGMIHKTPSGEDKRKVLLSLSPAGRSYVEDARDRKQEWLAHALQRKVSPAEKDVLMESLKILTKIIDE